MHNYIKFVAIKTSIFGAKPSGSTAEQSLNLDCPLRFAMFRSSRSFYGTNRPECRHEQTTPPSHDSRHAPSSQPRRRRLHPDTLEQPPQSESSVPFSALHERNRPESERRSTSTGSRAYGPGMLLHDNPCPRGEQLESESKSDRENFISPPRERIL